jgi:succinoglycan biosynthesis protein ExoA
MPVVTVIVPVRNEAAAIAGTLASLLDQDVAAEDYEVIVADGGSDDDTVAIVRALQADHANLKLLYNPKRWSSAARNLGVRHMRGRIAVVVDGHCQVPGRDYIRSVIESFSDSGADCLGRPQPLDITNPTPFQQAVSAARSSRLGHNPDSDIYSNQAKFVEPQSTAIAYRKEVFERVGLFDERFDACEDVEFNQRVHEAGLRCWFTPRLTIVYHPRQTLLALAKQLGRYGCGRARLARKHPQSLTLPALVPPLWCGWVVLGAVLSLWVPAAAWAWLASLALYAGAILGGSLLLARRHPLAVGLRIPAVFVGIHVGFGWGFLREACRRRY